MLPIQKQNKEYLFFNKKKWTKHQGSSSTKVSHLKSIKYNMYVAVLRHTHKQ